MWLYEAPRLLPTNARWAAVFLTVMGVVFLALFANWPRDAAVVCHEAESAQQELTCYSGGHLVLYEVCDETYMGNGYTQCVTPDGATIQSMGDCILTPIGYE